MFTTYIAQEGARHGFAMYMRWRALSRANFYQ